MKHATSIALHDYWIGCYARTGVPAGQIKAAELAPILPSLFLVDLDVAAGLRFRYCGASISRRYGKDLSDESFLALWNAEDRRGLERHLTRIALQSAGLAAGVIAETVGGGFTSFEMLLLPLWGSGAAAGAIGSMERIGGHDESNRIRARIVSQALRSVRFLPVPVKTRPAWRASEPSVPVIAPASIRRQYRHLTLVSGGK